MIEGDERAYEGDEEKKEGMNNALRNWQSFFFLNANFAAPKVINWESKCGFLRATYFFHKQCSRLFVRTSVSFFPNICLAHSPTIGVCAVRVC